MTSVTDGTIWPLRVSINELLIDFNGENSYLNLFESFYLVMHWNCSYWICHLYFWRCMYAIVKL